jgi:hypothetical protein
VSDRRARVMLLLLLYCWQGNGWMDYRAVTVQSSLCVPATCVCLP